MANADPGSTIGSDAPAGGPSSARRARQDPLIDVGLAPPWLRVELVDPPGVADPAASLDADPADAYPPDACPPDTFPAPPAVAVPPAGRSRARDLTSPRRPHPVAPEVVATGRDLPARPTVRPEPAILGLSRRARGEVGSRLFTWFFVAVFLLIVAQMIVAIWTY